MEKSELEIARAAFEESGYCRICKPMGDEGLHFRHDGAPCSYHPGDCEGVPHTHPWCPCGRIATTEEAPMTETAAIDLRAISKESFLPKHTVLASEGEQLDGEVWEDRIKEAEHRHTLGQVVKMTGEMPVQNTMGLSWQHGYERALEDERAIRANPEGGTPPWLNRRKHRRGKTIICR